MKRFGSVLVLLLTIQLLNAQRNPIFLGASYQTGFIIPHSEELEDVAGAIPYAFQVKYAKLKNSEKSWSQCNCFSRAGFSLAYFNYGNPEELGSSINAYYYVQPYFDYKGIFTFSLVGSIGLSYLTKVYDDVKNPRNTFFSSPLSFYLLVAPEFGWLINDNLELSLTINYNHISNGGSKQPNKGMNFPTISLGVSKILNYSEPDKSDFKQAVLSKKPSYYIGSFGSIRSANESDTTTNHLMIGINGLVMKPLTRINGLNLGVEFSYDDSYTQKLEDSNLEGKGLIGSLLVGHQFTMGRVLFTQQIGYHFLKPDEVKNQNIFQRYSIYYFPLKKIGLGSSLIANGHIADHLDVRFLIKI